MSQKQDKTGQINKIQDNTGQFWIFLKIQEIQEIQDEWEPCFIR